MDLLKRSKEKGKKETEISFYKALKLLSSSETLV
jgi:hypothetical protein